MVQGKVKDVVFDLSGTVTLVVEGIDGKDLRVPLARVTGISQHVVVRSDEAIGPSVSSAGLSCQFCGATLTAGQKWCPNCGRSQS
jgi:hypothetical protein